ncbi:PIG-L family deacetylase [Gryllotalpicola reticulitermitis]|uniref:PIG-L family deacetylase n=1 Tax=Gryllotalpicola reticulitermitis TaxID=1184153 RepID=A0ABV8Q4L6_9MICO
MVTFTHLDDSTSEEAWLAAPGWAALPELELPGAGRLLVVAAHPDDESLGAGALIALAGRRGWSIDVVIATDGEGSHPQSPTHTPEQLRARRRVEVRDAVAALAPTARLHTLGLPDAGLAGARRELRARLEEIIAGGVPPILVTPWCADGHGDHDAAGALGHELAREHGLRLIEYPIWLWHWATPESPEVPWSRFSALHADDALLAQKQAAMDAYPSQTQPLSEAPGDEVMLGPAIQQHFQRREEVYVEHSGPMSAEFFEDFYDGNTDPWGFETRWYEERKRAITLAALPRLAFRSTLEVGCATGILTAALAARTDSLLAIDIAETPLERARQRVTEPNVTFGRYATPRAWPPGEFDLIVLSEVGYYWGDELNAGIERMLSALAPDGALLACHWRHAVAEYPLSGDEVHEALRARSELVRTVLHDEKDFLLEVFTRTGTSVAEDTGLA